MKILILEEIGVERESFDLPGNDIAWFDGDFDKDIVEVFVTVKKKLGSAELAEFPNLKLIAVAFTGYDSVDLNYCRENNIAVCNVPAYSTNSVAELAVGLAISLLREIPKGNKLIREGGWDLGKPGIELFGKTVGICGTGAIGIRTAEIFKIFGCEIKGWSRTQRKEFIDLGGKYVDTLEELCSISDILSIHVPSNSDTKALIGKKQLAMMKKSAYLINTSRGPVVDEQDLYEALSSRKIAGSGIDVFSIEPVKPANPFLKLDNVILTPHIAFKTCEALKRRAEITKNNIINFESGLKENRVI
ncbi:MAG TPA: NAD(P)-dependent oxidoreductase [Clostridiales bacterium]|nr:NAD(P)-dependent oxidoreductase [Clostridiales bacterium]HQP68928.1 NAD(P)-dependent oxidoreductase [Clostridiales bacterium]